MSKELTIIIPLLDRDNYTKEWLDYNIYDEYNYIFADGSIKNKNEKILKSVIQENIKYIRYKPDNCYYDFYKKMYKASCEVDTKYVMISDNDDFINPKGIKDLLNYLRSNQNYKIATGHIANVLKKNKLFRLLNFSNSLKTYENLSRKKIISDHIFKTYGYVWYAIFEKDTFIKIWYQSKKLNIKNISYQELFFTLYSFSIADIKFLNTSHYTRRSNTVGNNASKNIFNNDKIKNDIDKIFRVISDNTEIESKQFISNLNNFHKRKKIYKNNYIFSFVSKVLKKLFFLYLNINNLNNFIIIYTKIMMRKF